MRLILASTSPRRAELLQAAAISFSAVPVNVDERMGDEESAEEAVARLAAAKAEEAAADHPNEVILAADTLVVIDGVPLGKPADPEDAARMLRLLAGRTHEVVTGVCVRFQGRQLSHVETTQVRMSRLNEEEIAWYVASGETGDKAGAYAVQGLASRFIVSIDGSYSNVVGLPVSRVYELLKALGCDILGP